MTLEKVEQIASQIAECHDASDRIDLLGDLLAALRELRTPDADVVEVPPRIYHV